MLRFSPDLVGILIVTSISISICNGSCDEADGVVRLLVTRNLISIVMFGG